LLVAESTHLQKENVALNGLDIEQKKVYLVLSKPMKLQNIEVEVEVAKTAEDDHFVQEENIKKDAATVAV
jgi:hypothetical protein